MSTHSVYEPHDDPLHVYLETDPLGDVNSAMSPPYSMSKIAQEAVARTCARQFDLPVVIARMNASYGDNGGLPAYHLDAIMAGAAGHHALGPVPVQPHPRGRHQRADRRAARRRERCRRTIVNWAGDEAVSVQEWCAYFGELTGRAAQVDVVETPGTLRGSIASTERRLAITGPCTVTWREGLRRAYDARYGDAPPTSSGRADMTTVLVTGASSGIGEATALAFARSGRDGRHLRRAARTASPTVLDRCREHAPESRMWVGDLADLDAHPRARRRVAATSSAASTCS